VDRHTFAGCRGDLLGQLREACAYRVGIKRLVTVRSEDRREMCRLDLAHAHVRIRYGQRPAAAIAGRTRIGARRVRADAEARTVEVQDRPAASRDRVDRHHGCAHAHAGHLGFECTFELTGVECHIGRGSTHVKADNQIEPGHSGRASGPDDASGRARQDGVLALELGRFA
jgi:hypothetical protein